MADRGWAAPAWRRAGTHRRGAGHRRSRCPDRACADWIAGASPLGQPNLHEHDYLGRFGCKRAFSRYSPSVEFQQSQAYPYHMSATTLLSLISPAVAVIIALWGFRRSRRADKLRAFFEIHERYLSHEARAGRRVLHTLVAGRLADEIAQLDRPTQSNAAYALSIMNSIAIACEAGYVERDIIARSMGQSYITAIQAARPLIDYLEHVQGFRPYPFAESLATWLAMTSQVAVRSDLPADPELDGDPIKPNTPSGNNDDNYKRS